MAWRYYGKAMKGHSASVENIIKSNQDYRLLMIDLPERFGRLFTPAGIQNARPFTPGTGYYFLRRAGMIEEPGAYTIRGQQADRPGPGVFGPPPQTYGPRAWKYERQRLRQIQTLCYDVEWQLSVSVKDGTSILDAVGTYIDANGNHHFIVFESKSGPKTKLTGPQRAVRRSTRQNKGFAGNVTSNGSMLYPLNARLDNATYVTLHEFDDVTKRIEYEINKPKKK